MHANAGRPSLVSTFRAPLRPLSPGGLIPGPSPPRREGGDTVQPAPHRVPDWATRLAGHQRGRFLVRPAVWPARGYTRSSGPISFDVGRSTFGFDMEKWLLLRMSIRLFATV